MIPKKEIVQALQGRTIDEMTIGEINLSLKTQVAELAIRAGEHKSEQFIYDTTNMLAKSLKSDYSRLYLLEVVLAIDFCGRGLTIEIKGISVIAIISAIKFYLNSPERLTAKQEIENKAIALLPEKTGWTDEEYLDKMRNRYRENLHRVRNGNKTLDLGGLLFELLQKKGFVSIEQQDIEKVTNDLIIRKKANPFDMEVKRCQNSDEIKKLMARENALSRYFHQELIMQNEAEKIKNNERN
jgi:hypothetical protein